MEIVAATREHILNMYGSVPSTVRAISILDENGVHCVAGIYLSESRWVMFAKLDDVMKTNKRSIIQGWKKLIQMVGGKEIYAVKDKNLETSESFIRHFGFKQLIDEVYVWKP